MVSEQHVWGEGVRCSPKTLIDLGNETKSCASKLVSPEPRAYNTAPRRPPIPRQRRSQHSGIEGSGAGELFRVRRKVQAVLHRQ